MKGSTRTALVWVLLILLMVIFYQTMNSRNQHVEEISFTEFIREVLGSNIAGVLSDEVSMQSSSVLQVEIDWVGIRGKRRDGSSFHTVGNVEPFIEKIIARGVQVRFKNPYKDSFWLSLLGVWFPLLLIIALFVFFLRQFRSGPKSAMSFGKSRHRMLDENQEKVTFEDVAGAEEAVAGADVRVAAAAVDAIMPRWVDLDGFKYNRLDQLMVIFLKIILYLIYYH